MLVSRLTGSLPVPSYLPVSRCTALPYCAHHEPSASCVAAIAS